MRLLLDPEDEHCREKAYIKKERGGHTYARIGNQPLHRILMGDPPGMDVDHINGITLDCRKDNLRVVTRSVNNMNSDKVWARSGFKGVSRHVSGRWFGRVKKDGKVYSCGYFDTPQEAHIARLLKEKALFGIQPRRLQLFVDAGLEAC